MGCIFQDYSSLLTFKTQKQREREERLCLLTESRMMFAGIKLKEKNTLLAIDTRAEDH